MENKRDVSNEGMRRILKLSLAKALDPVKRERRKEISQSVLLKRNERRSSCQKGTSFDGCQTKVLSQYDDCRTVTTRKSDSNRRKDVTPAATDDAVEDWDKEINDSRSKTASQFQESTLNKIQSLFLSYTSPIKIPRDTSMAMSSYSDPSHGKQFPVSHANVDAGVDDERDERQMKSKENGVSSPEQISSSPDSGLSCEDNRLETESHFQESTLNKIQSLFLSYTSPVKIPTDTSMAMSSYSDPSLGKQFPVSHANVDAGVDDERDERQMKTKEDEDICLKDLSQDSYSGVNTVSRNWAEESPDVTCDNGTTSGVSSSEQFSSSPDSGFSFEDECSCSRELSFSEYTPVLRNWAEESPDITSDIFYATSAVSSEQFSSTPNSGFSSQDYFNSHRMRKSVHSPEDNTPITRNERFYKPPQESQRNRRYQCDEEAVVWKKSLVTRSKSYSHQFIDSHCHIDFLYQRTNTRTMPFRQFVEENADSFPINYEGCVAVFCNPKVFYPHTPANSILQLLAKEDKVWVAVGCHPKNAMDFRDSHIGRLRNILLEHPKVVALGEIGLDYSGTFDQYAERQKEVFIQQLNLALELDLPLVIHCRDADADCLKIMKETVPANHKIHLHCFTRSINIARQWIQTFPNLCIGFTPVITYATAKEASEAAKLIPLDRMLLETDAPYFVPAGVPNAQVKGVSHPGFALFTAERLAQLKGVSVDTVLEACRENTRFIYGI